MPGLSLCSCYCESSGGVGIPHEDEGNELHLCLVDYLSNEIIITTKMFIVELYSELIRFEGLSE